MILTCGCEVTVTDPARIERACEQHGRIGLRDHFAGQALVGALAGRQTWPADSNGDRRDLCATACYEIADAMLKARGSDV